MARNRESILGALEKLGGYLRSAPDGLEQKLMTAKVHNAWFTPENCRQAVDAVVSNFLDREKLGQWLAGYPATANGGREYQVGVVAAGNIPLVGWHDVLCVLLSGHKLQLKLSGKDDILLPWFVEFLMDEEPSIRRQAAIVPKLEGFDAVIATGNNNSARYFEYYFGNVPHIVRKNRNSIAVLTGSESGSELEALGRDIFSYFGLGCRNVSKLYVPEGYDFTALAEAIEPYRYLADHNQYRNNLDYQRTILIMNNIPFQNIDFVNVTQNPSIASPISNLHYEAYPDRAELSKLIDFNRSQIQCIVGKESPLCTIGFGEAQSPGLADYADEVDTMEFLLNL